MTTFQPRWPWGHRHFQSILPGLLPRSGLRRRAAKMLAASRERILDCGDGVRLQALHARPPGPLRGAAILLHGWEGSADSYYVVSLATRLFAAGVEVVRLNLRDHGNTHHLNEGIFHSCRLPEAVGAVAALAPLLEAPPWLVGFSLGGNFMLRVAASDDVRVPPLAGVVAISPVLHPDSAMVAMEQGLPLYQGYFVRKWSRSLRRKHSLWPGTGVDEPFFRLRDLRRMTAAMVARHTEFPDIGAYLDGYAVTGERLATLRVPATLLAALDDPIIPSHDLQRLAASPHLKLVVTPRGGHMGFMETPWRESWVNDFVLRELGLATPA
ncbi:MAG TPA: alpha/beta fold hydrolase [Steroidobacteraceae bacterium]|nr:alpha/beta fold hydrolase [Steroidobacteraceae bacterium]